MQRCGNPSGHFGDHGVTHVARYNQRSTLPIPDEIATLAEEEAKNALSVSELLWLLRLFIHCCLGRRLFFVPYLCLYLVLRRMSCRSMVLRFQERIASLKSNALWLSLRVSMNSSGEDQDTILALGLALPILSLTSRTSWPLSNALSFGKGSCVSIPDICEVLCSIGMRLATPFSLCYSACFSVILDMNIDGYTGSVRRTLCVTITYISPVEMTMFSLFSLYLRSLSL